MAKGMGSEELGTHEPAQSRNCRIGKEVALLQQRGAQPAPSTAVWLKHEGYLFCQPKEQ